MAGLRAPWRETVIPADLPRLRGDLLPPASRQEVSREDAVAVLRLRNPPDNRLTRSLVAELAKRLDEVEKDDEVRAIVLAGEEDFSGGPDLTEWGALLAKEAQEEIERGFEASWALEHLSKPTIAAISGKCEGAGTELALACDLRIASESATFAFP